MATGVNYWSSHELRPQVRDSVWDGGNESSSEDGGGGGGGVTWEPNSMDVKGHLISAPEALNCTDRKQRERMAELQERRRSLQALLSSRLAELRRICLKEAELTGAVPSDFPLDAGEKPPQIRRRGGNTCPVNRKCQEQEEDCPRLKPKKHLFSGALRKNLSEHNTHSHHGKRTVHRGCHTDEAIRSESSSTSESTGHNNEDGVSPCLPPLVSAGSPTELFYQNKSRKSSFHTRVEPLHPQKHLLLPSSHLPPPPLRSQDSSSSSDPASGWEGGGGAAVLERITPPQEERAGPGGGAWVNGSRQTAEILTDGQTRSNRGACEVGGRGAGPDREGEGARGVRYSELLLDYVWGKQQQLQRQQSQAGKQPITVQHQKLFNGYSSQPLGAPPTYHGADQRRVTVTRTKSCGPFLPAQASGTDAQNPSTSTIQPDPHPHLLPPRPPQLPPQQDSQLEDATRSLHKALALEGLRDWYLRNTLGSSHHQTSSKVTVVANSKMNAGVKGYSGEGGALQRRRTTHSVVQPSTYQTEAGLQHAILHPKPTLPHSATFHGHPLHGRSDSQKQDLDLDQPSPGTLV